MSDLIDRQAAIEAVSQFFDKAYIEDADIHKNDALYELSLVPSVQPDLQECEKCIFKPFKQFQPKSTRTFVELVVEYPDPELCTYKEYKGKPYYSIKYIENGEAYVGYGTYKIEVLSQYLKEYFIQSAQPEIIRCKDCKWFDDIGCAIRIDDDTDKPSEENYCSFAERREE